MVEDYLFDASVFDGQSQVALASVSWAELGERLCRYAITSGRIDIGATVRLAKPLGSHGEHGMADGLAVEPGAGLLADTWGERVGLGAPGPDAVGEPKERPTDCTCGMGNGTQVYAHFTGCARLP